jgi:hypothetical protein
MLWLQRDTNSQHGHGALIHSLTDTNCSHLARKYGGTCLLLHDVKHKPWRYIGGSESIPPLILNFGTGCEWSASRFGRLCPWGKSPDIYSRGSWVGSRLGVYILEKIKICRPCRIETSHRPVCSLLIILTRIFRFTYHVVVYLKSMLPIQREKGIPHPEEKQELLGWTESMLL